MGRKTLIALVCMLMVSAGQVIAGEYHVGNYLHCADCHTMHYSQQHGYNGSSTKVVYDPTGPFPYLLKADPNDLCLACHDESGFAPDVFGANTSSYVRQAGALNDDSHNIGYAVYAGHTLGSKDTAPGGDWSDNARGLLCIDCHAPHGIAAQYRNLWTSSDPTNKFYNKSLTYAVARNDASKDVYIDAASFGMEARYGANHVRFNEPDPANSAYGAWCASCHPRFHGSGGSTDMGGAHGGDGGSSPWLRHPVADVNIGQNGDSSSSLAQYRSHINRVQVQSSSGDWTNGTDLTPSCFSCHKAHGNKNPFGLIFMRGNGTLTEEGDAGLTGNINDLCNQCHVQ